MYKKGEFLLSTLALVSLALIVAGTFLIYYDSIQSITGNVVLTTQETNVTACGVTLNIANEVYELNTSITGSGGADCITITANNITLDCHEFNITGPGSGSTYGIELNGADNVVIQDCTVTEFSTGIFVTNSENNIISNNNLSENGFTSGRGVYLSTGADNNTVSHNFFSENYQSGITLQNADNNTLLNNTIINHGNQWASIDLGNDNYDNTINGNLIINGTVGVKVYNCCGTVVGDGNDISNNIILEFNGSGIQLDNNNDDVTINNNTFNLTNGRDGLIGILASNNQYTFDNLEINNNRFNLNVTGTCYGIQLGSGTNSNIVGNNFSINATDAYGLGISHRISSNSQNNIFVIGSNNSAAAIFSANLTGNNIANNTITTNALTNNLGVGIQLDTNSTLNLISQNDVTVNNNFGGTGIYIFGRSFNNTFSHNNISLISTSSTGIYIYGGFGDVNFTNVINNTLILNGTEQQGILISNVSFNFISQNYIRETPTAVNATAISLSDLLEFNILNINEINVSNIHLRINTGGVRLLDQPIENYSLDTAQINIENSNGGQLIIGFGVTIDNTDGENLSAVAIIRDQYAFVNSTEAEEFNITSRIIFYNITFTNPAPLIDIEDDGTYVSCSSSICTEVGFSGGNYTIQVTGFTAYSSKEGHVSSSGGGGGGNCKKEWSCNHWTPDTCIDGSQERECSCDCSDVNRCTGDNTTIRTCIIPPTKAVCEEDWSCGAWSECSEGREVRTCNDSNLCNSEKQKPATEQDCTLPAPKYGLETSTIAIIGVLIVLILGGLLKLVILSPKLGAVKKLDQLIMRSKKALKQNNRDEAFKGYEILQHHINTNKGKIPKKELSRLHKEGMNLYEELTKMK